MRHWAGAKKYKLSSQLHCPIYCMPYKMHTLLRYQSCNTTNLFSSRLIESTVLPIVQSTQYQQIQQISYDGLNQSTTVEILNYIFCDYLNSSEETVQRNKLTTLLHRYFVQHMDGENNSEREVDERKIQLKRFKEPFIIQCPYAILDQPIFKEAENSLKIQREHMNTNTIQYVNVQFSIQSRVRQYKCSNSTVSTK